MLFRLTKVTHRIRAEIRKNTTSLSSDKAAEGDNAVGPRDAQEIEDLMADVEWRFHGGG